MERLGLEAALAKCQSPLTTLLWIGVFFDSVSMTMKIDLDKVRETIDLCHKFLQAETITHKHLQQLLGKIFYAIRCTDSARRFTSRLLDLLTVTSQSHVAHITYEARLDVRWLINFLPLFNGTTIMKPTTAEKVCFVDACPAGGGGLSQGHGFFSYQFPEAITTWRFNIASLEALNLLIAVRLWAAEWHGRKVMIFCDNWAVVCSANSGSANDPLIRGIIRELWWHCAITDVHLVVRHRPGASMTAADMLSRSDLSEAYAGRLSPFKAQFNEPQRNIEPRLFTPPLSL